MLLPGGFFRDLAWWKENLERRNAVPLLIDTQRGPPVIFGTDASDLASGGVSWISGMRETVKHFWTPYEKSLPINFRELAGSIALIEQWGPRIVGRRVLIETDNMAAMHCIRRRRARTEVMAEQLRRLYMLAARWDLDIRVIHTSGVDLTEPDAVSRSREPCAPRQRFRAQEWAAMSQDYGPFHKGLGAEMEHAMPGTTTEMDRTWYHPDHATVAETLKLVWREVEHARVTGHDRCPEAIVVLPDWEGARWQTLVDRRKMRPVRHWAKGSEVLEEWRGHRAGWVPVPLRFSCSAYLCPWCAGVHTILSCRST